MKVSQLIKLLEKIKDKDKEILFRDFDYKACAIVGVKKDLVNYNGEILDTSENPDDEVYLLYG